MMTMTNCIGGMDAEITESLETHLSIELSILGIRHIQLATGRYFWPRE
jgi:hypothetical protein